MPEYQVTCITKSAPTGTHEHITHIGGTGGGGWRITKEDAIRRIETKTDSFYTIDKTTGKRAEVGVVKGEAGKQPYLRTYADGKWNDNLLAQPTCPVK